MRRMTLSVSLASGDTVSFHPHSLSLKRADLLLLLLLLFLFLLLLLCGKGHLTKAHALIFLHTNSQAFTFRAFKSCSVTEIINKYAHMN